MQSEDKNRIEAEREELRQDIREKNGDVRDLNRDKRDRRKDIMDFNRDRQERRRDMIHTEGAGSGGGRRR